ncbi:4Fe-4S binding protein [Clostridium botulinum]|uniref:4Fe-4S binding protein n=1 Tax=Clostridium sp. ZBS12 TaxID=2949972 RepID=UPI0013CA5534|nr:4Fe-4S binding protein [Clostridium botulinum]NFI58243.1 4Fe-4S binding protein [Clostridium botulinum]NFI96133.1 4Fe-4S binding protein [Clostridium botulinum]NFO92164.1 4Fe-4S binding protein [Clostridium botulinum]
MKKFLELWKKYSFIILIAFIILGLIDLRFALLAIVCMVAPVIVSVAKGRFWCGNLCPRGSFYDNVVSKFSNKRKVPKFLKSYYFRAIVFVGMMTMFGLGIKQNWGNLYGIGMVFYRMIVVTTLIGIVLSLFYNHRTWCHFCPMGTIASVISKFRKNKKVLQVSSSCVSCKICEKKCPLGIVPYEYKGNILNHPDCIQCGKCVTVCPKKAIGYDKITLK